MVGGAIEGAIAVAVGCVDIRVGLEQQLGNVDMPIPSGEDERGVAIYESRKGQWQRRQLVRG